MADSLRELEIRIPCVSCGARPGDPCVVKSSGAPASRSHNARVQVINLAWLLGWRAGHDEGRRIRWGSHA